jgi:hypothetical protein
VIVGIARRARARFPARQARAAIAALATICGALTAPSAPAAPVAEGGAAAQQLWARLLTHCGESWFYAGSVFDRSGMLSDVGAGAHPSVLEFRGVRFNTVPIRVSEAERLNGISVRDRVTMIANVYREDGGVWQDGPALRPRNTTDVLSLALQSVVSDAGEMGEGGSMAFEVIQFKGKWLASRSGSDMSGPLLSSQGFFSFDQLQVGAAPKFSCAQMSAKVQSTLDAAASAEAQAKHDAALESAWNAPEPTRDPRRGIPYLLLAPDDAATLHAYASRAVIPKLNHDQVAIGISASNALADRFPIIPSGDVWLPIGTTFEAEDIEHFGPTIGGSNRSLMVVKLTFGPHAGREALIDAASYGASFNMPGRVWRDDAERTEGEEDAREDDKVLVRDPVRGVPYLHVSDGDLATLTAGYRQASIGNFATSQLEEAIARGFPASPSDDQWLAPGTAISPIVLSPRGGNASWGSALGGKVLALVRVDSGPHSGEAALIDGRNTASNVRVICPPDIDSTLHCDTSEEARERADRDAKWQARVAADAPFLKAREEVWQFTGSAEAFPSALAANLQKRAAQYGFNVDDYRAEVAALDTLAKTCMTVTPAMWQAAEDQRRRDLDLMFEGQHFAVHPTLAMAAQLKGCEETWAGYGKHLSPADKIHGLGVNTWMSALGPDGKTQPTPYVRIQVWMIPTSADQQRDQPSSLDDLASIYEVIDAKIPYPGSEAQIEAGR